MAKSLQDVLKGVKSSSKVKNDLGGYKPKAGDEEKFAAKHEIEKHEDRVGNGDDVYKGSTKPAKFPRQKDGVYEERVDELSTDLLHRAAHKAAKVAMTDVQGRSGPIFKKRAAQANKFRAKGMEQEKKEKAAKAVKEEAIDEISKKTLGGYIQGASRDLATRQYNLGKGDKSNTGKIMNRRKGIDKAADKLTNEGAKVDRMVAHIKSSEKSAGKSDKKAESIAWATANKRGMLDNKNKKMEEDIQGVAKKYKDYVTGGGTPDTASRYKSHVNMLSKKTGQHPDAINKQVRKHVKKMDEDLAVPLLQGDHDEGVEMVKAELKALANKAMHLVMQMPESMHVEPWCQAKIAQAKSMVSDVHDYMIFGDHEEDEQTDTPLTLPNMSVDVNTGQNV